MRTPPSSKTVTSAPATGHRAGGPLAGRRRLLGVAFGRRLGTHRRLESTLLRLVLLAFRDGTHVSESRPVGCDGLPSLRTDAEMLPDHTDHDPCLGRAETGQG